MQFEVVKRLEITEKSILVISLLSMVAGATVAVLRQPTGASFWYILVVLLTTSLLQSFLSGIGLMIQWAWARYLMRDEQAKIVFQHDVPMVVTRKIVPRWYMILFQLLPTTLLIGFSFWLTTLPAVSWFDPMVHLQMILISTAFTFWVVYELLTVPGTVWYQDYYDQVQERYAIRILRTPTKHR